MEMMWVVWFLVSWWLSGVVHEGVHLAAACACGKRREALCWNNLVGSCLHRCVRVDGVSGWRSHLIRHSGWMGSVLLAILAWVYEAPTAVFRAAALTAVEAVSSDAFLLGTSGDHCVFHCGNFGVIVLQRFKSSRVIGLLRTMVRITMMRGAQCGGVVSYKDGKSGKVGERFRVINGKRTDLSELISTGVKKKLAAKAEMDGPMVFAGHTRFATTSKVTMDGCHPHQWTPKKDYTYWEQVDGKWSKRVATMEVYICHNGDLDSFDIDGGTQALETLFPFIERATHTPAPSTVDSCGVAGVIDLVRTKGLWYHSVRYGFLFGVSRGGNINYKMPSFADFQKAADEASAVFEKLVQKRTWPSTPELNWALGEALMHHWGSGVLGLRAGAEVAEMAPFCRSAADAFINNDLFSATRLFLKGAKGSFGLMVSSSVDSSRQLVLAARGQSISVALSPATKTFLWGSELGAVKAGLTGDEKLDKGSVRLDLDDLGGESCLIDWGNKDDLAQCPEKPPAPLTQNPADAKHDTGASSMLMQKDGTPAPKVCERHEFMDGDITLTLHQETKGKFKEFRHRLIPLVDNPLVLPLPPAVDDPVGADIRDIPKAVKQIQDDWKEGSGTNAIAAWWLGIEISKRLKKLQSGEADGSIDLLLTGCEVSLWLLEQFASDLAQVFPKLQVRCISSNKLLGLFGQEFPVPQTGHNFNETSWNLDKTVVIIGSHSGGTFAPLACANLLQAYTKNIFVVSSEADTQIGKQLRQINEFDSWQFRYTCFTTDVGMRPAEACTVTLVGMHQMLTEILMHLMKKVQLDDLEYASGGAYLPDDIMQLQDTNERNVGALEEIVGNTSDGKVMESRTNEELKELGRYWALHILETPISWIMIMIYIVGTVTAGYSPVASVYRAIAEANGLDHSTEGDTGAFAGKHVCMFLDSIIYLFSPQLACLLLRIIQGRPLLHRMVGRTIVIGDIPYVAQSVEAFVSKLFAVAYSAAGVTVFSANPSDHLVHRMTHRVVRGSLLACGRPDGRLLSLTSAESSVCLSVNQASSIQNLGSTCESITIGHNPFRLPLTAAAVFLQGGRKQYLCENVLERAGLQVTHPRDSHEISRKSTDKKSSMDAPMAESGTSGPSALSAEKLLDQLNNAADGLGKGWNRTLAAPPPAAEEPSSEPSPQTPKKSASAPLLRFKSAGKKVQMMQSASDKMETVEIKENKEKKKTDMKKSMSIKVMKKKGNENKASVGSIMGEYANVKARNECDLSASSLDDSIRIARSDGKSPIKSVDGGNNSPGAFLGVSTPLPAQSTSSPRGAPPGALLRRPSSESLNPAMQVISEEFEAALPGARVANIMHAQRMPGARGNGYLSVLSFEEENDLKHEKFYGEFLEKNLPNVPLTRLMEEQTISMRLYESRIASLQRLVSFFVMFHTMGKRVQDFWPAVSFGFLNYDMSRTHSIMRIATTASPVSGAEVRHKMIDVRRKMLVDRAKNTILNLVKRRRLIRKVALSVLNKSESQRSLKKIDPALEAEAKGGDAEWAKAFLENQNSFKREASSSGLQRASSSASRLPPVPVQDETVQDVAEEALEEVPVPGSAS
mmetsp:Transcript_44819/g.112412  ORF Transcript_44819/g.112412 Transcript_44819/m.112412 type:complete len:1579 (+) Transcript_44819:96-4832(+)